MRGCLLTLILTGIVTADDMPPLAPTPSSLLKEGKPTEALKMLDAMLADDAKNPGVHFLRGEALSALRKNPEAIAAYTKTVELEPKAIQAVNQRGGAYFKAGQLKESLADFDAFLKERPEAFVDHWRRGITLYYLEKYTDGAAQFKAGDKVYGNDVENAFWHYLCTARAGTPADAKKALLPIGRDGRVPMMTVYAMLKGDAKPEEVIAASEKAELKGEDQTEALFYAHLYVGLYLEANGANKASAEHIATAVEKYQISHYMWDVAKVHRDLRGKK